MKGLHSIRRFALLAALVGSAALGTAIAGRGAEPAASQPGGLAQPAAPAKKHAVPSEQVQAEVLGSLREVFKKEIENKQPYARLALAAHLIRQARGTKDKPAEQYIMLRVARDLAVQQGDCLLGVLAVNELAARFDVSPAAARAEVLGRVLRQAMTPAAVALVTESILKEAERAADPQAYEALAPLVRKVEASLLKKCGPEMARLLLDERNRFEDRRELIRAGQGAVAVLEANADDAGANSKRGRFEALVREDWGKALPLLAKANEGPISASAGRLAADAKDVGAQLAMADAWWELAEKERRATGYRAMLYGAARHWYEQALPRLADADLAKARTRIDLCLFGVQPRKHPLQLALAGLAGLSWILPKKAEGKIAALDGYVGIQGKCSVDYPPVPVSSYILDVEATFPGPDGTLALDMGGGERFARVEFVWLGKEKKYRCRLTTHTSGVYWYGGERQYDPQQRMKVTLYVDESDHALFEKDGGHIVSLGSRPADLWFRWWTTDKTTAALTRCQFRPWTKLDAERLKKTLPGNSVECQREETALRFHEPNLSLREKPVLAEAKPFVVVSTGTPMVWVEPGKFQHPGVKDPKQSVEVTISRGFWIGRCEMTQGEWMTLVPSNPSRVFGSPFLPVDGVSYEEAGKFCALVTRQESRAKRVPPGYVYRLPTEAEWEYACRAGKSEDFSVEPAGIWSAETAGRRPHEVGQGQANPWGLYDMHGNVSEWCLDAWRDEPETPVWRVSDPFVLPKSAGDALVLRGGAWWQGHNDCSCRSRKQSKSVVGGHRGFRIALAPAVR